MQIKQLGMATPLKIEHRCVIKFCVNANMTPTDTLKFMEKGDSNVSRSLVFGWHKKFRDGLEDVSDRPRTGRPGRSEQDVTMIHDAISEDRRRSVREISDMTGICVNVVYRTLTENLNMNKVCARWVPRLLQQDQKAARGSPDLFSTATTAKETSFCIELLRWTKRGCTYTSLNQSSSPWSGSIQDLHHLRRRERASHQGSSCSCSSWMRTGWSCSMRCHKEPPSTLPIIRR